MRFYYHMGEGLVMDEDSLIKMFLDTPEWSYASYEEIQHYLHTQFSFEAWYECEVCDRIRELFEEKEKLK